MTTSQPYNTDGYNERGPQILSYRDRLMICRPAESGWEMAGQTAAVATLHTGNVVRQLLRPIESYAGLLGKMGMSTVQRPIIDHRDRA